MISSARNVYGARSAIRLMKLSLRTINNEAIFRGLEKVEIGPLRFPGYIELVFGKFNRLQRTAAALMGWLRLGKVRRLKGNEGARRRRYRRIGFLRLQGHIWAVIPKYCTRKIIKEWNYYLEIAISGKYEKLKSRAFFEVHLLMLRIFNTHWHIVYHITYS